jgi:LSD1 subclass zinc finger protein
MRIRRNPSLPAGSQTGIDLQLFVKCPGCGARLAIEEGARAVRCASCKESYFVPPWQYPFAAVVSPGIDTTEARRIARTFLRMGQHRATSVGRGQWRLVPFWRHRSAAFQWLAGERHGHPAPRPAPAAAEPGANGETAIDPRPDARQDELRAAKADFTDLAVHRLDLLFPAVDRQRAPDGYVPPPGIHGAYPLDPAVTVGATIEPVTLDFSAARQEAREEVERRCASGDRSHVRRRRMTLVGEEMILVYLPFFMFDYRFRDEVHEVVVDGVAGTIAAHRLAPDPGPQPGPSPRPPADASVAAGTGGNGSGTVWDNQLSKEPESLVPAGHAPLLIAAQCPACKAAITPRSPSARVHGCDNCGTAWEAAGGKLRRVEQHLAVTDAGGGQARYLPFWSLGVDQESGAQRTVYVPAFEAWQAERLCHLGVHLTRAEPVYTTTAPSPAPPPPAVAPIAGAKKGEAREEAPALAVIVSLGREDAERLAWVVLGSLASANPQLFDAFLSSGGIAVRSAEVLWLPFRQSGLYLRETVSGALVRDLPVDVEMPMLESSAWTGGEEKRGRGPEWPSAA